MCPTPRGCENPKVTARAAALASVRPRGTWLIPIAAVFVVATASIIPLTTPWATTYSGASLSAAVIDLLAGGGLVAAGAAVVLLDVRPLVGELAMLAGMAWLSADLIGWQGGPPVVRTLAVLAYALFPVLILHLLAVSLRGPLRSRLASLTWAVYTAVIAVAVVGVLFRDPLMDFRCWNNCTDDVLLVANVPLIATSVGTAAALVAFAAGLLTVGFGALALIRASAAQRHISAPVVGPICVLGSAIVAKSAAQVLLPQEGPQVALFALLFMVEAAATVLLAIGLVWSVAQMRMNRAGVTALARQLAAGEPGAFTVALARAIGDPTLEIAYPVPPAGRFVDASGEPVGALERTSAERHRGLTRIARGGRLVAIVSHDADVVDEQRLERAIGAAGRLALENERLRAELLARLSEVRASRERIVVTSDAERKRIERDLHDGAQPGILSLLHELRRARNVMGAADRESIDGAIAEAELVIGELRDVGHGIYPATLAERGLRAALLTLADVAPVPLEVEGNTARRCSADVEQAAYAVVANVVYAAARAGASFISVTLLEEGDDLIVELRGVPGEARPGIEDRVSVAKGVTTISSDGALIRAAIPCAS